MGLFPGAGVGRDGGLGGGDDVFIWLRGRRIVESVGIIIVYIWIGVRGRGLGPCWYFSNCWVKIKTNSLRIGFKGLSCRQKGVIRAAALPVKEVLLFSLAERIIVE